MRIGALAERVTFASMLGGTFLAAGILFAAIDSVILYKGWAAYGFDAWDKLSYGTAAASIPWTIVGFPFVFWLMWLRGRWRAVLPIVIAATVYLILLVYSLIGAMGSIATQRGQVIADRQASRESTDSLKDQRNRYRNELGWNTKHRPPGTVAAQIAAEKIRPAWTWTEGCRSIAGPSQRAYCTNLQALQGELEAARKSEDLHKRIAALSDKIDGRAPVAEKADPMAATLASWLGIDEASTTMRLPLATPAVLLIGEMVFVWFGFILLGINHKRLLDPTPAPPTPLYRRRAADPVTRGRELASWFFAECTRPVASGGLQEARWYALYKAECAKSNDMPVPLEEFRGLAQRYGTVPVMIDGQWHYPKVLPLVPREGAA